jgi:hypothetical protein
MKAVSTLCRAVAIGLCAIAAGIASAEPNRLADGRVANAHVPAPAGTLTVLYDQSAPPGSSGEYYTNADPPPDQAYASEGADDFEIADADGWTVAEFNFDVGFVQESGDLYTGTPNYNVHVYADAGGMPGDVSLCGGDDIPGTRLTPDSNQGIIVVPMPQPCLLPVGHYWVSFSIILAIPPSGMWGFSGSPSEILDAAMWRNPGNGFGTGCTSWEPALGCLGGFSGGFPAFHFQVVGNLGTTLVDEIFADGFELP